VTLTYDVHPEFGYFCPAPRLRRELRIALVSILFGMVIGAAFVTVRAGQAVETNGVSNNAHLKSSAPTRVPGAGGPGFQFKNADNAKPDPVEAIEPYPMRMVRVRSSKAASPIARIPLGHTPPSELDLVPASAAPALLDDRVPRTDQRCALCSRIVDKGYVRDSQTRLIYCDTRCLLGGSHMTMSPLNGRSRKVS
jgi:hypothetical protein